MVIRAEESCNTMVATVAVKRHLEDLLRKDQLAGFIFVDNIKEHESIDILRENDLEQFGIFIFSLRGMLITSQDERTIHQGMHYFI